MQKHITLNVQGKHSSGKTTVSIQLNKSGDGFDLVFGRPNGECRGAVSDALTNGIVTLADGASKQWRRWFDGDTADKIELAGERFETPALASDSIELERIFQQMLTANLAN